MTTYTPIPDSDIDPESPATTTLITRLRDNPIAIAEGASGAPRVVVDDGSITNQKLQPPTAGTSYLIRRVQDAEVSTSATTYPSVSFHDRYDASQHLGVTCLVAGTITAYGKHKSTDGSASYFRVLKNGVLVQEWSTSSTTLVLRSVNISVAVGDAIIFQQKAYAYSTSAWSTLRIYSDNPNFAVA